MNQIVKRKKKGRPSKADLARRAAAAAAAETPESDGRRRLRRRNGTYNIDIDDVIDEEDDENERRREKKLKLLLKGGGESSPSRTRRVAHVPAASGSSSEYGDGDNPLKKRKIDGDDEIQGEINGGDENEIENEDDEVRRRKTGSMAAYSFPETPSDPQLGLPLPDKKSLDLILDKLQKKDTYGVYAEPVDPEELPDYHDVIDHPMDFATVRKKLGNGSYSTLEQFESDVFLICSNAMQYNAPDTIYYKQAHTIEELAKKKFQRLRIDTEHYEKELKSEQKPRSNSLAKRQIKMPMSRTTQEPFGSDLLSGAILATAGVFRSGSNAIHAGGFDRVTNMDGPVVGNTPLVDNSLDKADDLQGRGLLSRFVRKPVVHDENRRATYNISNQPVVGSESIFTTFEGEIKQLVTVGLHADHSYARSLARFSTTLGAVAWNVASRRIEQALPAGFKFGRGWVGEYEPLSTPILMLENCSPKEPNLLSNSDTRKDDKTLNTTVPVQDNLVTFPNLEGKSSLFGATETKRTASLTVSALVPTKDQSVNGANLEGKQPFFSGGSKPTTTASANYQQQIPQSRNNNPGKVAVRQVLLNCSPISAGQNTNSFVTEKKILTDLDVPASRNVSGNRNLLQSVPFKQPENLGGNAGGLPNGKVASNNLDRNRTIASSSDNNPNQMVMASTYFPHGQEQGLRDPVQLMRILAENAQKLQKPLNHPPVDNPSVMPSVPSSRRDDSYNAASTAARTWMSIGTEGSKAAAENTNIHKNQNSVDSLYNSNTQLHPRVPQFRGDSPVSGIHFQPAKNSFPFQAFVAPPVRLGNEAQFQNRPMYFPQSVPADLSRFQMQSPWQGLNPHHQPRNKQESLPPDLNIGVQSSGSPVRQSSGVLVDSQQPDLALQL
ncbi:Bromodomain and PHD finger-containing protein [Actinidia chinensis var. chinensis]|uniref:Bromodomain and PHD finger-containing protein n=1 Tax=Actinidia chinensis var. chinensis TaxID=1590841 RepID=A0A2R6PR86_ACTCC|nr:Bromodomain and PHD finger-containing protein [Actinidia chinensis var. chinensis]